LPGVFLGHYGLAFAAKRATPKTSLGTLTFAAQWLPQRDGVERCPTDQLRAALWRLRARLEGPSGAVPKRSSRSAARRELWPILLLLGVEHVRVVPGLMAASDLDFVSYPISHSLLMAVVWSIIFGWRGGWILGALVGSHWVLDLLVHRPDLPLYPGGPRVGLGAWNSVPLTWALEALFYGGGLIVYLRTTKAKDGIGRWGLWSLVAVQVALYMVPDSGPPPSVSILAWSALVLWLFIPWAAWVDRHRTI
jgi:hypothetical protein